MERHGKTIQSQELCYRFIYNSFIPKANRTVLQRSLFPQFLEKPKKRQAEQTMKGVLREDAWDAPSLATAQSGFPWSPSDTFLLSVQSWGTSAADGSVIRNTGFAQTCSSEGKSGLWRWHPTLDRRTERKDVPKAPGGIALKGFPLSCSETEAKPYKFSKSWITQNSCYSIPKNPCETSLHIRPWCLMSFCRTVPPPWLQHHSIVWMLSSGTHPI